MKMIVNFGGYAKCLPSKHSPEEMCSVGLIPVNRIIVEDTLENKPSGYSSLSYFGQASDRNETNR
jgi:hypothetical protein